MGRDLPRPFRPAADGQSERVLGLWRRLSPPEDDRGVKVANAAVAALLRSPLHRVMSASTDLIRYTGTRSGRSVVTPTQYVLDGDDLIIMAGRPETKSWWKNFVTPRDVDVLLCGKWVAMVGEAVVGADQPEHAARLLDTYLARSPRAARTLAGGTRAEQARRAVFVVCRPQSST